LNYSSLLSAVGVEQKARRFDMSIDEERSDGEQEPGCRETLPRVAAVVLALGAILVSMTGTASASEATGDDRLMAVAAKLPGFGGMYVDAATDTLSVYSVDAANQAVTEQGIAEALSEDGPRAGNIKLLQAEHSFAQLNEMHKRMMPSVLGISGVVLTDIEEAKDTLTVGVEDQKTRGMVEHRLAQLGIPRTIVNIEETTPIKLEASLQDRHRPVVGGLQINSREVRRTLVVL
jgi:hypothetical protein